MKYRYAINQNKQIVEIDSIKNRAGEYICINCKKKMGVRLGQINVHHFYHLPSNIYTLNTEHPCTPETYLHKLAKELFFKAYCNNDAFLLIWESKQICTHLEKHKGCTKSLDNTLNLIEKYPYINIEKKDDEFIPDILLSNNNDEKIYLEFAYTHRSSKRKIRSNKQIIEIDISSEKDIELITNSRMINAEQNNISLYNFKNEFFDCKGNCIAPLPKDKSTSYKKCHTFRYLKGGETFFMKGNDESQKNSSYFEIFIDELFIGGATTFQEALSVADDYISQKN